MNEFIQILTKTRSNGLIQNLFGNLEEGINIKENSKLEPNLEPIIDINKHIKNMLKLCRNYIKSVSNKSI